MKKIIIFCVILISVVPAQAFMENPYGIYYAQVYDNGKYSVEIKDVTKKSVASKAGIKTNERIKSINNNSNLTMKNLKLYFEADTLPLVVTNEKEEQKYNLKAKNLKTVQKSKKIDAKINNLIIKNKYNRILKIVDKQISKHSYDLMARAYRVNALMLSGQYGNAINELNYLYEITKSPQVLGTISSVYITINDYEMAYKTAGEALKMEPNEVTANATMFICMTEKIKYKEALTYADKLVMRDSSSYTSYLYRGIAYKNLGNLNLAYKDLSKSYNIAKKTKSADIKTVIQCMVDVSEMMVQKSASNAKKFIETPSWYEICPSEYVYSFGPKQKWNEYWNGRRESYLASVNNCISNYSGQDLYSCFGSLRTKEFRLNDDYKILREHSWNQERREEIYRYTKDILVTGLVGAAAIKSIPKTVNVNHSGTINQNVHYSGSISRYNHYYFH